MSNNKKPLIYAVGLLLGGVFAYSGWTASTGMRYAADEQSRALDNMRSWKEAYEALRPVEDRWNEAFQEGVANDRQDLVEIARSLRLVEAGLNYSDKGLSSDKVESVEYEGVRVGLTRTCVAGTGTEGLAVHADSMSGLVRGLERLARKDLSVAAISTYVNEQGIPTANLASLCVMVRSEGGV